MKVIYAGDEVRKRELLDHHEGDLIILLDDNWDDYDYKTTFRCHTRINGNRVSLGSIQILIDKEYVSFKFLDKLVNSGWDGIFPIPNVNYISTASSMTFYEQIEGNLNLDVATEVANDLRDASYMTRIAVDKNALELTRSEGFRKSLQRERGSINSFIDGWKLFQRLEININDLIFNFRSAAGDIQPLKLTFSENDLFPHDINVLIGPNGAGKSQVLHQMVKHWLRDDPDNNDAVGFKENPNVNQMIVVSYSPFEKFPVESDGELRDKDVYKYFGLRERRENFDESGSRSETISLSRHRPKKNAVLSLLDCVDDDQKFGAIKDWAAKVKTMEKVLRTAIEFDFAAIEVRNFADEDVFFSKRGFISGDAVIPMSDIDGTERARIPIDSDRIDYLVPEQLRKYANQSEGVLFLKDGKPVRLSSGQRLFSYIVINVLGAMRRNSLILVDEPELFLHPTLEIAFIRMLKKILGSYGAKALIATHSLVIVRELPRNCVHVFERTEDGVSVKHPPFETFGSDIQRISSYVFGDKSVSKPFEEWIEEMLERHGSAKSLIKALGKNINEEMIIQINAMDNGKW